MRGNMPILIKAGIWSAICRIPPTKTAMASAYTGCFICGARNNDAAMKEKFSKTGVRAGILNSRQVFNTPPANATKDMKPM